jgi:hypothetical protein
MAGWQEFGPQQFMTRDEQVGNLLYDGPPTRSAGRHSHGALGNEWLAAGEICARMIMYEEISRI